MLRTPLYASICLLLLSGLLVAQSLRIDASPSSVLSAPGANLSDQVDSYYGAVNTYLASGDETDLMSMLDAAFIDWSPENRPPGTRESFVERLSMIRSLFPDLQISATTLSSRDDTATVSITSTNIQTAEFAGNQITPSQLLGETEMLTFEGGWVVERRSFPPLTGRLAPVGPFNAILQLSDDMIIDVSRWTLAKVEDRIRSLTNTHLLLVVEQGKAALEFKPGTRGPAVVWQEGFQSIETQHTFTLAESEAVYLPSGSELRLAEVAGTKASVLAVAIRPQMRAAVPPQMIANLPDGERLASTFGADIEETRLTLSFGHARLDPGAQLPMDETNGLEIVVLDSGALHLELEDGEATWRHDQTVITSVDESQTASAGESFAVMPGSSVQYDVTGDIPAEVFFVSIAPSAEPADTD